MEKEEIFTKEERSLLLEALKRLVNEQKPIYDGYQKFLLNEMKQNENRIEERIMSKEGQ